MQNYRYFLNKFDETSNRGSHLYTHSLKAIKTHLKNTQKTLKTRKNSQKLAKTRKKMPFSCMPGNVIHLDYNEDHEAYMKQVVDLLRGGNMIMVDYHNPVLYRYDDSQLGMVYMRAGDNKWVHRAT